MHEGPATANPLKLAMRQAELARKEADIHDLENTKQRTANVERILDNMGGDTDDCTTALAM